MGIFFGGSWRRKVPLLVILHSKSLVSINYLFVSKYIYFFSNWETQKNIDKIPKNFLLQLMYGSHNLWWGSLVFNRTWLKAFLFGNVFRFFCLRLCAMIYRSRFWWGVLYCDFQSRTSSRYVIWFENLKFRFLLIESSRLAVILS